MSKSRLVYCALGLLLSSGCGGDDNPSATPDGGTPDAALGDGGARDADASREPSLEDLADDLRTELSRCTPNVVGSLLSSTPGGLFGSLWERAVREGRLAFDAEGFTTCLDAVAALPCPEVDLLDVQRCLDDAQQAQVLSGGACYLASGRECVGEGCDVSASCPGVCFDLPGEGESCSGRCQRDYRCVEGTCVSFVSVGAPCETTVDCQPGYFLRCFDGVCRLHPEASGECAPRGFSGDRCPDGYGCLQVSETRYECLLLPTTGKPCLQGQCDEESFCDEGTCRTRLGEGALCTANSQCVSGLQCARAGDGRSRCLGPSSEGESCDTTGCEPELFCVPEPSDAGTTRSCTQADGELGSACIVGSCAVELFCDLSREGGVCMPRRGLDESCSSSNMCQEDFFCSESVCTPRPDDGEACPTRQCMTGLSCLGGTCWHDCG